MLRILIKFLFFLHLGVVLLLKCPWNEIYVSYFLRSIYSFTYLYSWWTLLLSKSNRKCCFLLPKSTFWSRNVSGLWNRVWGPSYVTSCIHAGRAIDSLIFLLDLFEFILHIVVTYCFFLPRNFRPPLTENTHYRHWREPKGLLRFTEMNATDQIQFSTPFEHLD